MFRDARAHNQINAEQPSAAGGAERSHVHPGRLGRTGRLHRLLIGCCLLAAGQASAVDLYSDDATASFSQLERMTETAAAAYAGPQGLRAEPTHWHNQFLRLADGRMDFRPYSAIRFRIRAESGSVDPELALADQHWGSAVRVAEHVDGGVIDDSWREAVIPMPALASDAFALDSVFLIVFLPQDEPAPFYVDDIGLVDRSAPELHGWSTPSNRVVSIRLENLDRASVEAPAMTLSSPTDPAFADAVSVQAAGVERAAVEVTDSGRSAVVESRAHLLLPQPLRAGHEYQLDLSALSAGSGVGLAEPLLTLRFDADAVSSSIKVNQVGYLPQATKLGFVGNWLGDLGPMPVADSTFEVVDAETGAVVLSGSLLPRAAADVKSGENVYTADFSALTALGRYRLRVPGIGVSHPFCVAEDVYADVWRTTMRVFYHKRNTALAAPYAQPGFERAGIDPLLDAVYHPILAEYPLSVGEEPFARRPISGGWFDAGDYGQYVHNAAPVWGLVGLAMDLAPAGHFGDGELGLPESGNGIPDILDELRWGMDWARQMQDTDGGVYWRVSSGHWDLGMPADVSEPRFLYEKTTRATAQLAAMAAVYARLMAPYDQADANAALAAAERAWEYANSAPVYPPEGELYQNPDAYPGGGTYAERSAKPDLLWAAAELYRSTGIPCYQNAYRELQETVSVDLAAAPYRTFAHWAMSQSAHAGRDILLVESARRAVMIAADIKLEHAALDAYRSPKHPAIVFTGWGNFSISPIDALALLQGYHLSGESLYLDTALQALDIMLGANPQSQVYLTGIGADPVQDPLDRISLNDFNAAPLPGLAVGGPTWHLNASREPFDAVNAAYWPPEQPETNADGEPDYASAYPVYRRWIDDHQLIAMNETTVREWAAVAVAFGLVRDGASLPPPATSIYAWTPGDGGSTTIYRLGDLPVTDVPLVSPAQITAFGPAALDASAAHLAALTLEQVAALDAPDSRYWVARLSREQQLALTPEQIAAFEQWSLFTALPPQQVRLIPPAKLPLIGIELQSTTDAWKAAVTAEQRAAMSAEQQAIMADAGY
ncbi:glycoside hydrolase family 9 protein [Thiohalocapsa halophila]